MTGIPSTARRITMKPAALAIDNTNSLYVGGVSTAGWYGPAGEEPVDGYAGRNDIAVLKLNALGVYAWHAFYGGDGLDQAQGIQQAGGTMALSGSSNAMAGLGPHLEDARPANYLGGTSAVAVYIGASGWCRLYGTHFLREQAAMTAPQPSPSRPERQYPPLGIVASARWRGRSCQPGSPAQLLRHGGHLVAQDG